MDVLEKHEFPGIDVTKEKLQIQVYGCADRMCGDCKFFTIVDGHRRCTVDLGSTLADSLISIDKLQKEVELLKTDKVPKWIPVTERMPEENGWYAVKGGGKKWACEYMNIAGLCGFCNSVHNPAVEAWADIAD